MKQFRERRQHEHPPAAIASSVDLRHRDINGYTRTRDTPRTPRSRRHSVETERGSCAAGEGEAQLPEPGFGRGRREHQPGPRTELRRPVGAPLPAILQPREQSLAGAARRGGGRNGEQSQGHRGTDEHRRDQRSARRQGVIDRR